MKITSGIEMKKIESTAICKIGIPSLVLMENAARATAEKCYEMIKNIEKPRVLIFAGKGNNGGDGLAAARFLYQKNTDEKEIFVEVIFVGQKESATEECRIQLEILEEYNKKGFTVPIHYFSAHNDAYICQTVEKSDLVVDAIIGIGLKSELKSEILSIVNIINTYSKSVLAIDIPTGVNSDSGVIMGDAVKADVTVTFHLPKRGLMLFDGCLYSGKIAVADISIPHGLDEDVTLNYLTLKEAALIIPERGKRTNKGTFGKVYLFAGSDFMPGACIICGKAAYKAGAGLVVACSTEKVASVLMTTLPEAITKILRSEDGKIFDRSIDDEGEIFKDASVIVVGPGIGKGSLVSEFVKKIASLAKVPVIIDADGLNAVAENLNILKSVEKTCIVTPHLGEMSRLTGLSIDNIKNNLINVAVNFAKDYNVITVLKDARTVIAAPDGRVYLNITGCSAMSKGGSGDCLTGVIAGLIAQKTDPFYAAVLATYVCGKVGEKLAEEEGEFGVMATESAACISRVISEIKSIL